MHGFTVRFALRASFASLLLACSAAGDTTQSTGGAGGTAASTSGAGATGATVGSGGAGGSMSGSGGSASGGGGAGAGGGAVTSSSASSSSSSSGAGGEGGGPQCTAGEVIYTLDANADLYSFDPPTLTFSLIGTLNCPGFNTPFSMAVDRNGTAWVVYTDGSLYMVSTTTAQCTATAFVPGQAGFTTFGMGFSTDMPMGTDETLYVSESNFAGTTIGLGKIDLQTLTLTPVAMYDQLNARAELTGTGDAQLFGAFEGSPYIVAEIDKTTAQILSQAPQTAINYPPGSSNFAFAFWGGDFWLFVGGGFSTDVFQYKPADGTTTLVKTVPQVIVGAGVSTCAPLHM